MKATAGSQPELGGPRNGMNYGRHAYHSIKVLELLAEATNTAHPYLLSWSYKH